MLIMLIRMTAIQVVELGNVWDFQIVIVILRATAHFGIGYLKNDNKNKIKWWNFN